MQAEQHPCLHRQKVQSTHQRPNVHRCLMHHCNVHGICTQHISHPRRLAPCVTHHMLCLPFRVSGVTVRVTVSCFITQGPPVRDGAPNMTISFPYFYLASSSLRAGRPFASCCASAEEECASALGPVSTSAQRTDRARFRPRSQSRDMIIHIHTSPSDRMHTTK